MAPKCNAQLCYMYKKKREGKKKKKQGRVELQHSRSLSLTHSHTDTDLPPLLKKKNQIRLLDVYATSGWSDHYFLWVTDRVGMAPYQWFHILFCNLPFFPPTEQWIVRVFEPEEKTEWLCVCVYYRLRCWKVCERTASDSISPTEKFQKKKKSPDFRVYIGRFEGQTPAWGIMTDCTLLNSNSTNIT